MEDYFSDDIVGMRSSAVSWSMDWRGFSRFDIPLLVRIVMFDIISVDDLAAATYQGFANKIAIKEILPLLLQAERSALKIPAGVAMPTQEASSFVGVSMVGIFTIHRVLS